MNRDLIKYAQLEVLKELNVMGMTHLLGCEFCPDKCNILDWLKEYIIAYKEQNEL